MISLSEVIRRGIWTIFRVENEHCTNVGKFKASRDVELPYALTKEEEDIEEEQLQRSTGPEARRPSHSVDYEPSRKRYTASPKPMSPSSDPFSAISTGADLEAGRYSKSPALSSLRRRQQQQGITPSIPSPGAGLMSRVGTMLQGAHAQDFERKKKSPGLDGQSQLAMQNGEADDEDDSDEQDTERDTDAQRTEDDDGFGPRARARRALSGTGGFNIGQSEAQRRQDRDIEESNRADIAGAEEALRLARGESNE